MSVNESTVDRVIRGVLGVGLVLIGLFAVSSMALEIILIIVGAILVITSIVGFCPIYKLLGIKTN